MKLKKGEALILRTCKADMTAHSSFKWPKKGHVKAPDWKPSAECGNGLHGLLWGEGDGQLLNWASDAVWMVCKVVEADCVNLSGKVKFPACEVIHAGKQKDATDLIALVRPGAAVVGLTVADASYSATMTGGNYATMTGGDSAKMTGGYSAKMTGGDSATMTGGNYATMTGGNYAKMTGGDSAVLQFTYWDGKRQRVVIAYVGENGIEANKPYKLDESHKPKEVSE